MSIRINMNILKIAYSILKIIIIQLTIKLQELLLMIMAMNTIMNTTINLMMIHISMK